MTNVCCKVVCGIVVCVVLSCVIAAIVYFVALRECPHGTFSGAAVAADSEKCSQVGRDMLQRGGSAVDGAIAALLCTSVINPQSNGIGGGCIFTVMDSSGKVKIINSRETVPEKTKPDLLQACSITSTLPDPVWIGVPGEIRGYELAHKLYGKLPWASLFEPTIKLAREGFPIPLVLGKLISETISKLDRTSSLYKLYTDESGNLLKAGDIVKFEKLADTLELIAIGGPEAFYSGDIAKNLTRDIQEAGGILTLQDLETYRANVSDALVFPLGDFQMYFPPPPAGGVLLGLVLNIMKGYNMSAESLKPEQKTLTYHRYIESLKFANGLRKHIRDPNYNSDQLAKTFIEDSFAEHIRSLITNRTHEDQYYNLTSYRDSVGTTHVSVLAEDGSAVSVTSSINDIFGSKVFSPTTGIILNNQLSDFCGRAESIHTGEKPPSSKAPAVLKSQSRTIVIGASGGNMITTGIASALMDRLWFGKSLKEAIESPVLYFSSLKNRLKFERNFDKITIESLRSLGHDPEPSELFNVVNAVEKDGKCIWAESDDRKLGKAAGY